jgi:hypothetical protein
MNMGIAPCDYNDRAQIIELLLENRQIILATPKTKTGMLAIISQ